jgi:HAD superfamily hydrolase (TIGR01509 family)
MTFQGIVFDFNGVLWWDSHLQEQAWREFAFEQFGISLTDEIMTSEVHGCNNKHTLEFLAGTHLDDKQVEQLSNQKEMLYRRLCLAEGDGFQLSPGAIVLLDALRTDEIPRTIATASGKDNLLFFIEQLQLERWFDPVRILYDDSTRPGKPAPDIYLQAAKMIGLNPGYCVVVEDSIAGIQAACAAGMGYIIALIHSDRNQSSSTMAGIDLSIENLTQLPWEDLFNKYD